jgi:hypothetical protein
MRPFRIYGEGSPEEQDWDYWGGDALTSMTYDGITIHAVPVPADSIDGKNYDVVELTDGMSAVVAISQDFMTEIMAGGNKENGEFGQGFSLGMLCASLMTQVALQMSEELEFDDE